MGSKQNKRKGVFAIVSAIWWLAKVLTALVNSVKDLAKERGLSDDAVDERVLALGKPEGAATIKQMAALILGKVEATVVAAVRHIIDTSTSPYTPSGWKVEEHRKGGKLEWDPAKVSLYLSPNQQGGKVIKGEKLRWELNHMPVLNANILDYLLAHPELIPESWKGKRIYFWGTIYRDSHGDLYVRCLYWGDGRWDWDYHWLDDDWDDGEPAALASV